MMNSAFISDKCDRNENNHNDQDDALFAFGDLENPEKPLHFFA